MVARSRWCREARASEAHARRRRREPRGGSVSRHAPPRVLLGTRSLHGLSLATRDRILGVVDRYRGPEAMAVTLSRALDAGAEGLLASPTALLTETRAMLRRPVPIHAVVPSLTEQERLELEPGVEPVLRRRLSRGRNGTGVRIAF